VARILVKRALIKHECKTIFPNTNKEIICAYTKSRLFPERKPQINEGEWAGMIFGIHQTKQDVAINSLFKGWKE
jgi:hypothetical protein